jgi:5-methylthioribose kinase
MFELDPDNTEKYLRRQGWIGTGPCQVELLGGGVSNMVLRVRTAETQFVLKQSRPQLRTRDAWFSDIDRIWREMEVMQALAPLLPPQTVPDVLFCDRDNHVFAMSHAPEPFRVWKEMLLAGEVSLDVGRQVGRVLGRLHQASAGNPRLGETFHDIKVFDQLRIDPFYRTVQRRCPDVAALVEPIVERMYSVKEAICHGDYTPKNMLVHDRGFTLVDYETAYFGDPTMDVGLLLAHLILKSIRGPGCRNRCFDLTRAFWQGYAGEVRFRSIEDLQARGIEHLAVCLLARIDGTSPVDYLPQEAKRDAIRRLSRQLLREQVGSWDDVLQYCTVVFPESAA